MLRSRDKVLLLCGFVFATVLLRTWYSKPSSLVFIEPDNDDNDVYEYHPPVPIYKTVDSFENVTKVIIFAGAKYSGQKIIREALKRTCKGKRCKPLCDILDPEVFHSRTYYELTL